MLTNLNNLKDTLSGMDLQGLQDYARVNKNDPYIVSMALSMANTLKKMEVAKKGRAGMQPQPKVVDQQIAQMVAPPPQQMAAAPQQQMLPEDTGIGQLPAQNMQRMAEGGIVAFEEGGDVPGYADGGVPSGAIIMGNMYQDPVTGQMKPLPQRDALPFGNVPMNYAENRKLYEAKKEADLKARTQAAQSVLNESPEDYALRKVSELEAKGGKKLSPDARNMAMSQFVNDKIKGQVSRGEASLTTSSQLPAPATTYTGIKALPGAVPPGQKKLNVDSTVARPTVANAAKTTVAATPVDLMTGITALNTKPMTPAEAMAASKTFGTGSELTESVDKLRADTIKSNEDLSKAYKEGLAGLAKPGEQAEERLKQREAEDAVSKADAKAMAIFKAGLGMMAGTSRNAFENIGKGAMAGLEEYSASIKDFRKLAIERDKAYAEIEAARNAAARDDFKTSVGLQEKATDRLARVNEKGIDITATLFKTNKDAASNIWNTSTTLASANARSQNEMQMQANKTLFEQSAQAQRDAANNAAALERTRMQVNAPSAEERVLSNDKLFGRKMDLQTAATGLRGDDALIAPYMKDPVALSLLEQTNPLLAAQIKQKIQMRLMQPQANPASVNRP
jgi:hypothetical protein